VDRFLRPSSGLGQFADYLLAATGSPIGGALMAMRQQEQEAADRDLNRRYKEAQIQRMEHPQPQADPEVVRVARFMYPDNPEKQREYILSRAPQSQGPANVQEWQYYNALSPEDQRRYLEMKRAEQTYLRDVEGAPTVVRPGMAGQGPVLQPLSTRAAEEQAAQDRKAAEARGAETGKGQAQAMAEYPVIEQSAQDAIAVIDALLEHPGFEGIYGLKSYLPIVRGSDRAGANALRNQIGGIAFLRAYETLKGGGHITEIEGLKATQALTRLMDPSISPEEARKAAEEFKQVIRAGLDRARRGVTVGNSPQASPMPVPTAPSSGWSIEEVR